MAKQEKKKPGSLAGTILWVFFALLVVLCGLYWAFVCFVMCGRIG